MPLSCGSHTLVIYNAISSAVLALAVAAYGWALASLPAALQGLTLQSPVPVQVFRFAQREVRGREARHRGDEARHEGAV